MTPEDVRERVEAIKARSHDDEDAHWEEDKLHRDVLHAIADGTNWSGALAEEALKTQDVEFSRWYA